MRTRITDKKKNKKKIIVALSGGVDSSVAAALLKKAGFEVEGAHMRLNGPGESEIMVRRVCEKLEIPFHVFNFEKEFKKKVVENFLKDYESGKTPNPCVVCNKEIKFGLFMKKALSLGADFIATGHYAEKEEVKSVGSKKISYKLRQARDDKKDQSYFLWKLNQFQLEKTLFPLKKLTKTEVRKLAKNFGLPTFNAPESQEICFIREGLKIFLRKNLKKIRSGKVLDGRGMIIGNHNGLVFYTIGQRRGIGLSGGPYYVLSKNRKKNSLIVTKNPAELKSFDLKAFSVSWISGQEPELPIKVRAKIRYRHKPAEAVLRKLHKKPFYGIRFFKPQSSITPGQSVVFLKGTEILGGGIIS